MSWVATDVHVWMWVHMHTCKHLLIHTNILWERQQHNNFNWCNCWWRVPDNPSWPITAGSLFPQIHHTENMSNALGNNPILWHAEKGKLSLRHAGFGLPGTAQNAWGGVSDSISRYRREASVIGKCCPSRKLALFNKQCPLKKFKIFQRKKCSPSCGLQCFRTS